MLTRWNSMTWPVAQRLGQEDFDDLGLPLRRMRDEMHRIFSDFEPRFDLAEIESTAFGLPHMALFDDGDSFVVRAELPGVSPNDLTLTVDSLSVSLGGERKLDSPEGYSTLQNERVASSFFRRFALPAEVDPDGAEANLDNGVLSLRLPKLRQARPKQIPIRS